MDSNSFEQAIKSDLAILSTLQMGYISAKDLYGRIFKLTLKLSFLLLAINTGVRLALMASGLYPITLSVPLMIGTWIVCFLTSLVFGFAVSRFILISQLIKGRLKTDGMIRKTFRYLGWVCLGIYISVYAFITLLVVLGFDGHLMDSGLLAFTTLFSQAVAFIAATSITGLLFGVELDRLGLGALFNVLSELITKARKSHHNTHSAKDA